MPLIGTNDIHYVHAEDAKTQDMLLCIATGKILDDTQRMRFSCDRFYMRSAEEMAEALDELPGGALQHARHRVERALSTSSSASSSSPCSTCRSVSPAGPSRRRSTRSSRRNASRDCGSTTATRCRTRRWSVSGTSSASSSTKGFAGYFLVVQDFIHWAKANGIGVGPGRGSAAGSIISYALGITALDPLEYGLLFERFLNPERAEMPDIDIDFDDERRGEVIDYVRAKYGEDKVAQIITFQTMKARAAVRDAGRILGYPFGVPDKIAKMIQEGPEATIASSMAINPDLKTAYATDARLDAASSTPPSRSRASCAARACTRRAW